MASQQALLLLLLLLMKLLDKHLNGREQGSLFLCVGLHGVGLLCGIDCRCVLEKAVVCLTPNSHCALQSVVHIVLSARHR